MIRLATDQETQQIIDLWSYCFDDSTEFIKFFFQSCYKPENTLIVTDGDKLCSCLQLLPYRMQMRGKPVNISYIVGVATWPEYRGKGYVSQLLQYADKIMNERSIYLSILLPFQYDFYRKFGWEVCYDLLTYHDMDLPVLRANAPIVQISVIEINKDIELLSNCYHMFMRQYNGFIVRCREDWFKTIRDIELDNGSGYIYKEMDHICGYILYTINDKRLIIKELIYTNANAKASLLQLAISHKGQVNQISWKAPAIDTTYLAIKDSRGQLEKETFVMGRIHDVIESLSGLIVDGGNVKIKIIDPLYHKNNGCFFFKDENNRLIVTPTDDEPDIELNIHTLNQLLWGFISVDFACIEGYLKCPSNEALENLRKVFPPVNTYMIDEY